MYDVTHFYTPPHNSGEVLWYHFVCPCVSICHPGVSIFVEFHILRAISVYSIIMGLNLHCGVKKIGVVGLKRSKKDQRDNLIKSVS